MGTRNLFVPAAAAFALAASSATLAQTPSRVVVVNGEVASYDELLVLDALNCASPVPNGRYWLNSSGAWGFEGGPQQGVIGGQCRRTSSRSYTSGDISQPTRTQRSPAGSCAFYSGGSICSFN